MEKDNESKFGDNRISKRSGTRAELFPSFALREWAMKVKDRQNDARMEGAHRNGFQAVGRGRRPVNVLCMCRCQAPSRTAAVRGPNGAWWGV